MRALNKIHKPSYNNLICSINDYYDYLLRISDQLLTMNEVCLRNIYNVLADSMLEKTYEIEAIIMGSSQYKKTLDDQLRNLSECKSLIKEVGLVIDNTLELEEMYVGIIKTAYEINLFKVGLPLKLCS